ncbi:hypothetical protein Tco_1108960 [Tanacetum coccineum]
MKNPRPVPGALVPWAARQVLLRIAPLFGVLAYKDPSCLLYSSPLGKSCTFVVKPRSLGDLVWFEYFQGEVLVVLETLVMKKVGDQDVGDDSVRDVSLNLRESMADRIWRIKGDGIGVSAHADMFSLASSFEGFTSSFGELNPKSLIMNPTSGPKIEVAAWSNATPAGVSNDSTTTPAGGANMEAKSRVQHTSANEQQVVGDRSKTHVDLVSSSLNVPCVPGTANVVALFGVPLNTLGDFDNLTKDIKLGKYEVWSNLPSEKRAAGGSKSVPSKSKTNFRLLFLENLCEGANFSIPKKVVETVFLEDGLSIIASQIGKPVMLDSYTSSIFIELWERRFTIETVTIEYEWKPPCCDLCKIFGHVHDHCPKTVSIPPTIVNHNAVTPTV